MVGWDLELVWVDIGESHRDENYEGQGGQVAPMQCTFFQEPPGVL